VGPQQEKRALDLRIPVADLDQRKGAVATTPPAHDRQKGLATKKAGDEYLVPGLL